MEPPEHFEDFLRFPKDQPVAVIGNVKPIPRLRAGVPLVAQWMLEIWSDAHVPFQSPHLEFFGPENGIESGKARHQPVPAGPEPAGPICFPPQQESAIPPELGRDAVIRRDPLPDEGPPSGWECDPVSDRQPMPAVGLG